jgi:hypothetical protein
MGQYESAILGNAAPVRERSRSRRPNAATGVALASFILLGLFALNAGRLLVVDNPQPADLIVVLAGETQYRPAYALQLLDRGYAPRILLNVPENSTIYRFTQLQLAETYVHGLPQGKEIAICPIRGLSTREESYDVLKCLAHDSGTRILIVTSDYHTRRSLSIFRHELPGKTFFIAAVPDGTQFGTRWWKHRQWAKTCFDEWLRLLWWSGVERWR